MTKVRIVSHADENLASHRMRVQIPADVLNEKTSFKVEVSQDVDPEADVHIFHKHFQPQLDLGNAIALQGRSKTIFDICDDHFDREMGDFYTSMCEVVDVVTCNSENMQERIYECTGRLAQICYDPITFPYGGVTKFRARKRHPKALWYGHISNIFSIVPYIGKIPGLTIVTNKKLTGALAEKCESMVWKPGLVEGMIEDYEVVVLPKISTPEARCKSPNRAVDALHSGKFVITDFSDVYGHLSDYIYVGDILDGVEFLRTNSTIAADMAKAGQRFVIDNYNHRKICEQWVNALNYIDISYQAVKGY